MKTVVAVLVALAVILIARRVFGRVTTEGPRVTARPGVRMTDACPGERQAWNGNTNRCEPIPEEFWD
jgi:hypothetical protein